MLVSILGLIGDSATQPLIDNLGEVAPGPAQEILTNALENLQGSQGAAGFAFVIGLVLAIWSASGYVAAFMRASNAIYDIEEGRPIWKTLPMRVGLTVGAARARGHQRRRRRHHRRDREGAGDVIGVGDTAVTVWNIAKWPVLLLIVSLMFALLYWAAPNVKQPASAGSAPAASWP